MHTRRADVTGCVTKAHPGSIWHDVGRAVMQTGNRAKIRAVYPAMSILPASRLGARGLVAVLTLGACGAGGASAPGAPAEPIATSPEAPVDNEPPILVDPMPGAGGELTIAQPGQLDVHPVPADSIEAAVDGTAVTIKISWTSGVEPCSVLDTIVVERGEMAFAMTIQEGHAAGDNICIEIAKFKFALVDLGELEPGTYTVSDATGGAAPIEVTVS